MTKFRPKYITFDCYGTLTNFQMAEAAQKIYGSQLDQPRMAQFIKNFAAYRLDEILGDWKPYNEVIHNAVERTCRKNGVTFRAEDARSIYETVPSWGPHPDVPAGLAKVAKEKGGLNMLVQPTAGETVIIPLVARGEAEFGLANSSSKRRRRRKR